MTLPYPGPNFLPLFQIEDLSQQAQMAAAEKFKAPEPSLAGRPAEPATITPALAEESEEEEEVST